MLRDGMRRNLWAIVLSGLAFFLSLLLPVLMYMQNTLEDLKQSRQMFPDDVYTNMWNSAVNNIQGLVGAENPIVKAAFIVLAVVCGVAMFAYLHSRQKVDFYHSLPISRTRLFASNFVTGIVCTVPMYFIMLVLTLASVGAMGFGEAVNASIIGGALLDHMVGFMVIYALTVLTTIVCGNTVITLLLLLWVMFSPMLIKALQTGLFSQFYSTFNNPNDIDWIVKLSPVTGYFALDGISNIALDGSTRTDIAALGSGITMLVAYTVVAVLAVALACWLFKIRRSERAGSALAFEPMKLPVKVYMCLVMGTAVGLVFLYAAGPFWFWPGLVLGTVIFHAVVEIIYAFDFKAIFAKPAHMGIILAVLLVVMAALKMDVIGYDKWMPSESSVSAVALNRFTTSFGKEGLTSAENIQVVRRIAEIGIENLDTDWDNSAEVGMVMSSEPEMETDYFSIAYKLSSGRIATRQYNIPYTDEVKGLIAQITASEEYKRNYWGIFQYEEEIQERKENGANYVEPRIDIYDGATFGIKSTVRDEGKVLQILQTFEQDVLARKDAGEPLFALSFGFTDPDDYNDAMEYTQAYVTKQDVNTLALIKQLAGVEPEPLPVGEVKSVRLEYYDEKQLRQTAEITDKADISKILENALNYSALQLYDATSFWNANKNGVVPVDRDYKNRVSAAVNMGDDMIFTLCWPKDKVPVEILGKYCTDMADDGVYTWDVPTSEVTLTNPRSVNSSVGWIG